MDNIREWMFRALMFEAEAEQFRTAGIRLGADLRDVEAKLLEEVLSPFPVLIRNQALQMARIYALMNCFENSVRDLIAKRLEERHGADWWEKAVPSKVKGLAVSRQKKAKENSWLEGDNTSQLSFAEFGNLGDIILACWEDFDDLIPTQHWLKQRMDEPEQARNFLAHNRLLLPAEFQRIEMYIADWNRQVGL
jgi:hypothetical protein